MLKLGSKKRNVRSTLTALVDLPIRFHVMRNTFAQLELKLKFSVKTETMLTRNHQLTVVKIFAKSAQLELTRSPTHSVVLLARLAIFAMVAQTPTFQSQSFTIAVRSAQRVRTALRDLTLRNFAHLVPTTRMLAQARSKSARSAQPAPQMLTSVLKAAPLAVNLRQVTKEQSSAPVEAITESTHQLITLAAANQVMTSRTLTASVKASHQMSLTVFLLFSIVVMLKVR